MIRGSLTGFVATFLVFAGVMPAAVNAQPAKDAKPIEWDHTFHLVKVNPLVHWTWADVWTYIKVYEVPYNPLHVRDYPSIGCTHCTKPVMPGDDPRSGRWQGRDKTECGLHKAS